ncbi:MAG: hypothetical protein LR017_01305 [Candidatus Pacebacteria bacterium]|nr:hypothetical protein [Candidatus Paceibacterota bacterium]
MNTIIKHTHIGTVAFTAIALISALLAVFVMLPSLGNVGTDTTGLTMEVAVASASTQFIDPPACPFKDSDTKTVFEFTDRIYSSKNFNNPETDVESTNLPAGDYKVHLFAYDGYVGRTAVTGQNREQYRLVFLNGANVLAESGSTADLADGVETAQRKQKVNNALTITDTITGVKAVHAAWVDNTSPNSLWPVCAMVERIPDPLPTCDAFDAQPSKITKGASATLTWETTDATEVMIDNGVGVVAEDGTTTVAPTTDTTYTLTAKNAAGSKTCTTEVVVEVPENPVRPACPFAGNADRTVVSFNNRIRSDQDSSQATTVLRNVNLDAGSYKITLFSWDGYNGREQVSQPDERWYLGFFVNGTRVQASDAIGDLADTVREAQREQVVETKYMLTQPITGIKAIHAKYPDTTSANSVEPVCAMFEKIEVPAPTCDAFAGIPASLPIGGGDVTFTWETTNATDVSIDQGVGTVDPDGSKVLNVTETKTYTLTATGAGGQVTCEEKIIVATPNPEPQCTLAVTPDTITKGDDVTLTWSTVNADTVSIDQGIGSVTTDGSTTSAPTTDTTYTLTATGHGKTVTCDDTVTIEDEPVSELRCDAFTVSDSSVHEGSSVELKWNTTGATSVSIDQGIGAVAVDGDETVTVNSDTTYTLTATDGTDEVTCTVSVDTTSGGGGGGSSSPRCELEISDTKITKGEEITLTWDNARTNDMKIEDNRGNVIIDTERSEDKDVDEDDGSITLKPTRDTEYTMTVFRGSRDRDCKVEVEIEDDVTLSVVRDQQPLVVSLGSVPYTGFEAGPTLTAIFYTLLIVWSLGVAYVLVIRKSSVLGIELPNDTATEQTFMPQSVTVPEVTKHTIPAATDIPSNLPTATYNPVVGYAADTEEVATEDVAFADNGQDADEIAALENRANEANCLLSSNAIRFIIEQADTTEARFALLDTLINKVKEAHPLEDGWAVINKERAVALMHAAGVQMTAAPTPAPVATPASTDALAAAIMKGDVVAAYATLGENPLATLATAAADLDAQYRATKGQNADLDAKYEAAIGALTSAIDGTYSNETASVKLAVMKAVKAIG